MSLKEKLFQKFTVKSLVYSSVCIAIAFLLNLLPAYSLPYGGSFTFCSMFFICIVGYFYGSAIGIMAGVAFGLINLAVSPYVIHPVQLLLDYPIAFGALGFSGFFADKKRGLYIGYIVGCLARFLSHTLSGYIFFQDSLDISGYISGIPTGIAYLLASMAYNISYIGPEIVLTLIIISVPSVKNALAVIKKNA